MKEFVDYYEILGLKQEAASEEINKAFRKKVMELRPDLNYDDVTRMRLELLQEAKKTLSNSLDRKLYDSKYSLRYYNELFNFLKSEMKKTVQEYEKYVKEMNQGD